MALDQAKAADSSLLQVIKQKVAQTERRQAKDRPEISTKEETRQRSAESTASQLDLFSVPPSQTSLENRSFTEYHPVSVLTSTGSIEFRVSTENSNYIDLANSFLYVRTNMTTAAGANLAEGVEVAPECNVLSTLWSKSTSI